MIKRYNRNLEGKAIDIGHNQWKSFQKEFAPTCCHYNWPECWFYGPRSAPTKFGYIEHMYKVPSCTHDTNICRKMYDRVTLWTQLSRESSLNSWYMDQSSYASLRYSDVSSEWKVERTRFFLPERCLSAIQVYTCTSVEDWLKLAMSENLGQSYCCCATQWLQHGSDT